MYDVIIVGGGPAGLSAALILGRCLRKVVVCDAGEQRNRVSNALHGFLTRDGIPPGEFLRVAREELRPYGVELLQTTVADAELREDLFHVKLEGGRTISSRKLLLATGVCDRVPVIEGMERFYGKSVHHCPYCDAWEHRGKALAVYGRGKGAAELAVKMKTWSPDVALVTDGRSRLRAIDRQRLERHRIPIREQRIVRLEGDGEALQRIVFDSGEPLYRSAMFFAMAQDQSCDLARRFGCLFDERGSVCTNRLEGTNVPGLYVAGDASRDVQLAIVAAAEGAKAGFAINTALQEEEARRRAPSRRQCSLSC